MPLPLVPERIPEIHFADAQHLLARNTREDPRGEPDLAPAHERWLSDWAMREHGSEFLFVTGYPMIFAHGMPPHGGFAIGLERWVGRLVEAANIREVTLFPRDLHRLAP